MSSVKKLLLCGTTLYMYVCFCVTILWRPATRSFFDQSRLLKLGKGQQIMSLDFVGFIVLEFVCPVVNSN